MSRSIDTRIVEMKFDNAQFERGIQQTLKSLAALQKGMKLDGATNGLNQLNASASRFSLGHIANQASSAASRLSAMGVVGVAALGAIAAKGALVGANLVKSMTISPLKAGLEEYETNLNSIQTIMANTGLEGKAGLGKVNHALEELNHYSDQTIYNFSEMAKNIGTFTAAGIKLEPATAAIKGIANLAAISGSNSQQASTAMYQLSQAMAAGKATLVDWNSVVNAGMGGKVFQEALKETARVQGQNVDAIIKKNGSFRDSLQEGWLTTEVLTETLQKFTGDLNAQQLKSMGYNEKQIAGIIKMGKTAQDAATKVKTVSQLIGTLQEAASSGWAKTWQLVFGDFDEARNLFTSVNNVLGGMVAKSADARNKVLSDWKKLGGRTVLIQGIADAFKGVMSILKPIKDAFRQIFPPTTGSQLFALTKGFAAFAKTIAIGAETANNIKRTFAGVFAVFSIGISIIKGIARAIGTVVQSFSGGSGGILEFTGNIGDWLVALDKAIKSGDGFMNFFEGLGRVISVPIKLLQRFIGFLADLMGGVDEVASSGAQTASKISASFNPLERLGGAISSAWRGVGNILKAAWNAFSPLVDKFTEFFSGLGDKISESFGGGNFDKVLDGINTGLLAGIALILRSFLKNGIGLNLGGGPLEAIAESFGALTGSLTAMQTSVKAGTLLKIAGAVALLTVSVVALSMIDSKKLSTALGALAVMFGQLLGSMLLFEKVINSGGFLKMPFATVTMIGLAVAINLLALAVGRLANLNWTELAKGLSGVVILIGAIAGSARIIGGAGKGLMGAGAGMILLALGINILVNAVESLADLSWQEMAKGLVGVAALLLSLALFSKLQVANAGGIAQGAGLLLLAAGIKVLASAMEDLGQLTWGEIGRGLTVMAGGLVAMGAALMLVPPTSIFSAAAIFVVAASLRMIGDAVKSMAEITWGEIAKGLGTMAGALTLISIALALLPPTSLFSAAAIFVVAASLGMVATALGQMGGMSWVEIAKGLIVLAGSLGIIAGALTLMVGALPGAAALLVAAAALRVLSPVLMSFAGLSWGEIAKGLTMLAGAMVIFTAAGIALGLVSPLILALGLALGVMGAAMLAAGAGMALFGVGLTAVAAAGAAAASVIVAIIKKLAEMIPFVAGQVARGIAAFAKTIAAAAAPFAASMTKALVAVMNAITRNAPRIAASLANMLVSLLNTMARYIPRLITAGSNLIVAILNGVAKNVPRMVTAATNVIVAFINGVSANQGRVIQAGVSMIIGFVNGVANAIRANSGQMNAAGRNLGSAIVQGMVSGISGGIGAITGAARSAASSALSAAKGVLGINSPSKEFMKIGAFVVQGFAKGIDGNKKQIDASFRSLAIQLSNFVKNSTKKVAEARKKLAKLYDPPKGKKRDNKAIAAQKAVVVNAIREQYRAMQAYKVVNNGLKNQRLILGQLANRYDVVTAKLGKAREALGNITKARNDFYANTRDKYATMVAPQAEDTATSYIQTLKKQLEDTKVFNALLQRVRALGLNDESYRSLLDQGTSAIPFVTDLLKKGKPAVKEINSLSSQLDTAGIQLGANATNNLYRAGVNAAAGLVKGLQSQQAALEKTMDKIALSMVNAIKRQLKIKSPSRVFAEVGKFSVQGIAKGFDGYSHLATRSAGHVGTKAVQALRDSISGISDVLVTDGNFNPVIRPVLDLTGIEKKAAQINTVLSAQPLSVRTAFDKAKDASNGYLENRRAHEQNEQEKVDAGLSFVQNNYSPKAISPAETYRNTRNQLSVAKGALRK